LSVRILAGVPITFETASGGTTHTPLVMASIRGASAARYVVDTGSEVHLLNEDFVEELGLNKEPGEEGTDHAGNTMPSWSVGDVAAEVGGLELPLREVVAIPAPAPFPGFGIRGILSPQNLHPSAWTVIDMAADELILLEATDEHEAADYLRARTPALELLTLARNAVFPSLVVGAALDGFAEMPTMLNTGGKATEYSAASLPGLRAEAVGRLGGGVSGADYSGGSVGSQDLVIGGRRLTAPNVHIREQMHEPQGIIGMDVLRGTVLTFAGDLSRPVFWQVP
jgi:hypothetical protein